MATLSRAPIFRQYWSNDVIGEKSLRNTAEPSFLHRIPNGGTSSLQANWNGPSSACQKCVLINGLAPVGELNLPARPTPPTERTAAMGSTSDWFQKSPLLDPLTTDDLVLANSDKKLLMSLNGGTLDRGSDDFNQLMTTIGLDRSVGNLKGDMTRDYITNLISQAKRDLAINPKQSPAVSIDFLQKALAAYDAMHAKATD
jgi:hypothetical protein